MVFDETGKKREVLFSWVLQVRLYKILAKLEPSW